jgi:outer membrane protein assembly factor BamD
MRSRRSRRIFAGLMLIVLVGASTGCSVLHRRRSERPKEIVPPEDLYAKAKGELEKRHLSKAKSLLEGIQFTAENRATLEPLARLALADALFYAGDSISLIDARSKYIEFATLYGDNVRAPYAQFQTGICSMKQISSPSRDQGQTRIAITDFDDVQKRYPDSPYASAARGMIELAEASLAEHEFLIGKFYMKRKAYFSASERFRGILETYPRYADKQKVYLELGRALILAKNSVEGTIYLDKLVADYPGDSRADEARKLLAGLPDAVRMDVGAGDLKPR